MQVVRTACMLAVLAAAADAAPAPAPDDAAPVADKRLGLGGLVGSVASASAGLSASSSSASSSSSGSDHDPGTAYGPPVETHHDGKQFDLWTFKKELLRSLFQIVKALKGGLLALKGHVLKTKGNILATKGRMLAAKGEAIKNFGKSVAANAFASSHPSTGYGPPSGGYPASGHPSGYASSGVGGSHLMYSGPPPPIHPQPISSSGFGGSFSSPAQLYPLADLARVSNTATGSDGSKMLPDGATAGLLILKPVNLPVAKAKSQARASERERMSAESTSIDFSLLPHPDLLAYGQPFHF